MKKIFFMLVALLALFLVNACTTLDVSLKDGSRAKYKRYLTGIDIKTLEMIPQEDGSLKIKVEGLSSDISEAIGLAGKVIDKIPGTP